LKPKVMCLRLLRFLRVDGVCKGAAADRFLQPRGGEAQCPHPSGVWARFSGGYHRGSPDQVSRWERFARGKAP